MHVPSIFTDRFGLELIMCDLTGSEQSNRNHSDVCIVIREEISSAA